MIFSQHLYTKLYWITSRRFTNYFLYIHLGGELRCRRFGGLTAVERGCLVERRDLATRQTVGEVGDERWIGSGQGIHSRTRVAITKGRGGKSMARKLQSYKLSCSFIALARTAINQPLSPSFLRAFNIKIQGKSSTSEDLHTTMRDAGSAAMAYPLPAHALAGEVCKVPTANHPNLSIHHI